MKFYLRINEVHPTQNPGCGNVSCSATLDVFVCLLSRHIMNHLSGISVDLLSLNKEPNIY